MSSGNPKRIQGQPVSPGLVVGTVFVVARSDDDPAASGGRPGTLEEFRLAASRTREQLARFQRQLEDRLEEGVAQIFFGHLTLLDDPHVQGEIEARIRGGAPARGAIRDVIGQHARRLAESPAPVVREKAQDLRDLCRRLVLNLDERAEDPADYDGQVLVVPELLPSDLLRLVAQRAGGIVLAGSGVTAHIGVLARSLQIPLLVIEPDSLGDIRTGAPAVLDGSQGILLVDPAPGPLRDYRALAEAREQPAPDRPAGPAETRTRDGVRVRVFANVGFVSEVTIARRFRAEGIGLYRSEIPFIIRRDFPGEEDQVRIYRRILEGMEGAEVLFRALDIGGDKMLSYFPHVDQANPFLGLRGMRFLFRHPDVFKRQLRAMLRAGAGRDLRIMFPLVASVDGFIRAREITLGCIASLAAEGVPHHDRPRLGAMVELPSAVGVADELAAECDFLSIGSNDLVQYMLAVDRTNDHVSTWYLPWHPAVLRAIRQVVEAGRRHGKPVSICGDMARDPRMIPLLVGMGLETLSVPPSSIPTVQDALASADAAAAQDLARRILAMGRIRDVTAALGIDWSPPSLKWD